MKTRQDFIFEAQQKNISADERAVEKEAKKMMLDYMLKTVQEISNDFLTIKATLKIHDTVLRKSATAYRMLPPEETKKFI